MASQGQRRDSKHRILHTGESIRANGKYQYKYMVDGKMKFKVQMPEITPHICRYTYCSNQAKAGMNPKTLQYLMGHSDIGVTMNTYTHLGLDDVKNEMIRMEELEQA